MHDLARVAAVDRAVHPELEARRLAGDHRVRAGRRLGGVDRGPEPRGVAEPVAQGELVDDRRGGERASRRRAAARSPSSAAAQEPPAADDAPRPAADARGPIPREQARGAEREQPRVGRLERREQRLRAAAGQLGRRARRARGRAAARRAGRATRSPRTPDRRAPPAATGPRAARRARDRGRRGPPEVRSARPAGTRRAPGRTRRATGRRATAPRIRSSITRTRTPASLPSGPQVPVPDWDSRVIDAPRRTGAESAPPHHGHRTTTAHPPAPGVLLPCSRNHRRSDADLLPASLRRSRSARGSCEARLYTSARIPQEESTLMRTTTGVIALGLVAAIAAACSGGAATPAPTTAPSAAPSAAASEPASAAPTEAPSQVDRRLHAGHDGDEDRRHPHDRRRQPGLSAVLPAVRPRHRSVGARRPDEPPRLRGPHRVDASPATSASSVTPSPGSRSRSTTRSSPGPRTSTST